VERIALNAKDAGLSLQPTSAPTADLRLVRIPMPSADPWIALFDVAGRNGISVAEKNAGVEDLYSAEQVLLAARRIIPLFDLSASYAASTTLKNWSVRSDGVLDLDNAWLGSPQP
jgi:hypothetical protein